MSLIEQAKRIKEVTPDDLLLFKSGSFYRALGKDAYIISGIFGYSIKTIEQNIPTCGFPVNTIIKIKSKLENTKINYKLVDPRNNYYVDEEQNFRNLNTYEENFNKMYSRVKDKKRVDKIAEELTMFIGKSNFKDIIRKIEDLLDEAGKI